jgi:hypothetical protein
VSFFLSPSDFFAYDLYLKVYALDANLVPVACPLLTDRAIHHPDISPVFKLHGVSYGFDYLGRLCSHISDDEWRLETVYHTLEDALLAIQEKLAFLGEFILPSTEE